MSIVERILRVFLSYAELAQGWNPQEEDDYQDFVDAVGNALAPAERAIGELLAVIHGDGGHYLARHGVEKAATDALSKVYALMQQAAEQPAERARLPDGWVLVPREPTTAILEALESTQQNTEAGSLYNSVDCWEAMLEAAPQPGES